MNPIQVKMLIVDDCPSTREIVCELMKGLGIVSIDEATDGQVALELFKHKAYDLVISDWNMPHLSGLELLRAIRRGPLRNETPVLLLRAGATAVHMADAREAGATALLAKPFSTIQLCDKVLRIVASLSPVFEYRHAARVQPERGETPAASCPA